MKQYLSSFVAFSENVAIVEEQLSVRGWFSGC